ncbi:MAG: hypothetical protein J0J01_28090 [Reyranella sp.]|uniref:hypothetical protein n=1 Tax=Reyranella sp. TaxID=1929291 RepID=UPI001AC6C5FA|nr:hypothetical protein [Reyranella sp.]MBN9090792.1 hypothetical protein [Reyranella sp.]
MTALTDGSSLLSAGAAWRRALVVSLRDLQPAAVPALIAAGFPVLLAAWALMSPATLFSKAMSQDLLFNLAGAWQVYLGQVPHVDFHDPSGRLSFLLTALGFYLLGPGPFAFLVNVAVATTVLFAAAFIAAIRRLPMLPAVLFIIFTGLLALVPANIGDRPDQYTFAMSYNRYGWAAYGILALILFVAPQPGRRHTGIDLAVAGVLLALMFYFKITYFAVGLATVGFALLFHPHVRRRWPAWLALMVLLAVNAVAPWNRAYLGDIFAWATTGAIRHGLALHINNFVAAIGLYVPYLAAIAVAGWMWVFGRASFRFPLTLAFVFVASLALLSQNSQAVGLPSGIVMLLILYDRLRRHFTRVRNRDIAPLLLTLLFFPFFEASRFAASIAGYHASAGSSSGLYVVDHTNLRTLAVPEGRHGTFLSFSRTFDYPARPTSAATPPRYQLTEYEYMLTLLQAADLLEQEPGGIALFDSINPLPFMLGREAPRGANLWSTWNAPPRPAEKYLADVRYVLIPKFSLNPRWTEDLVHLYGSYLQAHFATTVDAPCWILLIRTDHGPSVSERPDAL